MKYKRDEDKIDTGLIFLAKASVIVFIGIFLSKLFTYLYKIVIGRFYGPEEYGLFSLAIMILGFFTAFASLGFSDGLNRFLPIYLSGKKQNKIEYLITISKKIFFIMSIIFAIILFSFSDLISVNLFHNPSLATYLKIFSLAIPFQLYSYLYYSIIRSYEKVSAYSFGTNIFQNVVKLIILISFIFVGIASSMSISFSYVLGILAMALFGYFYCKKKLLIKFNKREILKKYERKQLFKEVFSYSWPLLLFSIVGSLVFWIDTFSIGILKNSYWVGIYNAAVPLALLLAMSSEIFMQMFFPIITKELSLKNYRVSSELSKQVFKWIFAINLPVLFLIVLFPGVFINFFWGKEYLLASNSLVLLSIGYFFFSLATVSNNILSSIGKSKTILFNLIFISFFNLLFNFILIPKYGIEGSAFATMICLILWSALIFSELYFFSNIVPFRRKLLNVLISAIISASILYPFTNVFNFGVFGLILFAMIYGIIYASLLLITKSLDKNDWMILKKVYSRLR